MGAQSSHNLNQLVHMSAAQANFQNKIFIQMEKENAWQMFGYRVKYNRTFKMPEIDIHANKALRTDIGQQDCKNVNYRYDNLAPYQTKRRILRLIPKHAQSDFNILNNIQD